jgi:hypothetical protein
MKTRMMKILVAVVLLATLSGVLAWSEFYRVVDQPASIKSDPRDNYFYGSVGSGRASGLPYWIWLAIPRLFPEYMPGPGGYAALGMSWEEGKEMPAGFAKQRIGYVRVTGNCALCHAISRSSGQDRAPTILTASKGHTTDIRPLLAFYTNCAKDPRFNADELFSEINTDTNLSLLDSLVYRYVLIPRIRKELIDDPASVLFDPALRDHARDPRADAPLSDPQATALKAWMQEQMKSTTQ